MPVNLFKPGETHASGLIGSGKVDDSKGWTFTAEDGDKLLGASGDDWGNYAAFHLGEDTGEPEKTKARYKYPYGKDDKLFESALSAIKSRAGAASVTAIADAATRLQDKIEKKEGDTGKDDNDDSTTDSAGNVVRFRVKAKVRPPAGYKMVLLAGAADAAEIYVYGPIGSSGWFDNGSISAAQFRDDLKALGAVKSIALRINSEGGDVFDAKTMYTMLLAHDARVVTYIDGLAASAASLLAMAGDEIIMAEGAFFMIHKAWSFAMGNAGDMRKTAQLLDQVDASCVETYAARTKCSADDIARMMSDETWMTAKEALTKGFCDKVVDNLKVAAAVSPQMAKKYAKLPSSLRPNRAIAAQLIEQMRA